MDVFIQDAQRNGVDLSYVYEGCYKLRLVTPAVGDTELQTVALGATRQVVTSRSRSNQTLTFTLNISSSLYTRPITISELAVYFIGSSGTNGAMFARGLLSTTVTLATNDTASVTYGVLLRWVI